MATRIGKSNIGLLKYMWHEMPDIVAGTALSIFSIIGMVAVYKYRDRTGDWDKRRYRFEYTVVRPDDPLAKYAPSTFPPVKKE